MTRDLEQHRKGHTVVIARFEELDFQPSPMGALMLRRRTDAQIGVDIFEVKLGEEFLMSSLFTVAEEEPSSAWAVCRRTSRAGEIYQALEKGTIDAAEWIGPYDDQKLGFNKVAPHYAFPGWWEGGPQLDLFVNTKADASLSAEYKAILEAAAAYAHTDMQAKYDAKNPGALRQLVAGGTKLFQTPKDIMEAAFKEAMSVYSDLSAKNPRWKKVYEDYAKFRGEQVRWFSIAEDAFDTFMIAQARAGKL